ncbi:hypothetical protein CYK37_10680 [Mesorhizobium loti]|nr:hypothetical protein CYK37_10680 [Mesorhizobium loti]
MADLPDLISNCQRLKGPSPELDRAIERYFSEWEELWAGHARHRKTGEIVRTQYPTAPAYTASLDAAVALAEQVLPGWHWGNHPFGGRRRAYVVEDSPLRLVPIVADHSFAAIALVLATLRARQVEEGVPGHATAPSRAQ